MKSPAQFSGILTDEIITCGAPTKLVSDSARVETSKEVRSTHIWHFLLAERATPATPEPS
jgi:hypothetical protein